MPTPNAETARIRDELETLRFKHHCMELFYRGEASDGSSMHERITAMRDARIDLFMAEAAAGGLAAGSDT